MNKKVYIFTPAHIVSGGPEALHQLRYYMEKQGIDAWIVYMNHEENDAEKIIPDRYSQYFPCDKKCILESEYEDNENNLVIMPEHFSFELFKYKKSEKAIWWLGVFGYDGIKFMPNKNKISRFNPFVRFLKYTKYQIKYIINCAKSNVLYYFKGVKNYCASQFAYDYVTGEKKQKAYMLVEPISKDFLDFGMAEKNDGSQQRKKSVLFNPSKPSELMTQLLNRGKFEFVPIQGYTPEGMVDLYRSSRVYVDFGIFPGPERMPKEAVYNGCNILVAKRNASVNNFDVAIPDKYKIDYDSKIDLVEEFIGNMLENYEEQLSDFDDFRTKIGQLEYNFEQAIGTLFKDYIIEKEEEN